jgi:hypothetical protein
MPLWTEDDREALTADETLSETVYYYPAYGSEDVVAVWEEGVEMQAVFIDEYKGIDLVSGQVASTDPMLYLDAVSDATSLQPLDRFLVRGIAYTVTAVEPDGTGITVLRLRKA